MFLLSGRLTEIEGFRIKEFGGEYKQSGFPVLRGSRTASGDATCPNPYLGESLQMSPWWVPPRSQSSLPHHAISSPWIPFFAWAALTHPLDPSQAPSTC